MEPLKLFEEYFKDVIESQCLIVKDGCYSSYSREDIGQGNGGRSENQKQQIMSEKKMDLVLFREVDNLNN